MREIRYKNGKPPEGCSQVDFLSDSHVKHLFQTFPYFFLQCLICPQCNSLKYLNLSKHMYILHILSITHTL